MKVLLNTSLRFFAKSNFPTTVEPLPMPPPPPFHSPHTCPHTWVLLHQSIHVEKRYSFDQFIVLNAVNYCLTGTSLVQTPWKKLLFILWSHEHFHSVQSVISIGHLLATCEMERELTYFNSQTQITNMYSVSCHVIFSF